MLLRRSGVTEQSKKPSRITFADIVLDDETHEVWKAGELVSLSPTEFTLLRYFMVNAGTVLSKPRILDHVWNYDFGGEVNVVESYVSYLRRKLDNGDKRLIHTLRGVGYVMREPRDGWPHRRPTVRDHPAYADSSCTTACFACRVNAGAGDGGVGGGIRGHRGDALGPDLPHRHRPAQRDRRGHGPSRDDGSARRRPGGARRRGTTRD